MSQKLFSRTVHQDGNSKAVTLPAAWTEMHDIETGDELKISVDGDQVSFAVTSD